MIYFRCDGNSLVGGGHVMRCLSIAKAFIKKWYQCIFLLADKEFDNKIKSNGFNTVVLNSRYDDLSSELDTLTDILSKDADLIIIDSYFVNTQYLNRIKAITKAAYVDDLALLAYPVDCLINYNIYAKKDKYLSLYDSSSVATPHLLLGPNYAPLRDEFINIGVKKINEEVKDVLILTGVSDSCHISLKLIDEIMMSRPRYRYHFVIGEKNNDIDDIISIASSAKNISIYYKLDNINELMQKCDVAVSAAGSTLYELCRTGTPTIAYAMADNQLDGLSEFEKQKLMINIGDIRRTELSISIIETTIKNCLDYNYRVELSQKMQKVIDGKGATRMVEELLSLLAIRRKE